MKPARLMFALALISPIAWAQSRPVMIASVDVGRVVSETSAEALRTKTAIEKLRKVCPKDRPDLAVAIADVTHTELTAKGNYTTGTEAIEGVHAVVINYEGTSCADTFARYVTMRKSLNYSHAEAVASLRAIMVTANSLMKK